ncbi:hypothetical protein Btru_015100 [Bulinus truncatus]|nr:hypothetical protein Btru_015100 [Bulinus truncatus]
MKESDVHKDEASSEREITQEELFHFRRSLSFLRYWPIEKLKENPAACSIHYFHRSTALVRDSNNSDWIYVVLKGSLSVLKKLKKCSPGCDNGKPCSKNKVTRNVKNNDKLATFSTEIGDKRLRRTGHWKNVTEDYPDLPDEHFKSTLELETKLNQTLPGYINTKDRLRSLDYDKIIKSYQSKLIVKSTHSNDWLKHKKEQVPNGPMKSVHVSETADVSNGHQKQYSVSRLPDIDINNKVVHSQIPESNSLHQPWLEVEGGQQPRTGIEEGQQTSTGAELGQETTTGVEGGQQPSKGVDINPLCTGADDNTDNDLPQNKSAVYNEENKKNIKKMAMIKSLKGAYLAATRPPKPEITAEPKLTESTSYTEDEAVLDKENEELSVGQRIAKSQLSYQLAVFGREGRKTIAEELDQRGRRDYKVTEADLDPVFIQVQVLERGQYFGIVQLVSFDEPSLSVVSNGAECLVISKKLFKTWASEKCWRHLRQTEFSYPSDEELAKKLKEVLEWQKSSSAIYQEIQSGIQTRKSKQKQFLPAYLGQYCFRTGPV